MNILQPIAILGGTFDPVHNGHLAIALEIQQAYNLAEVRFIPCWQPVHRAPPIATPEQRLAMLACALKDKTTLTIDDCEIQRQGPSYMIETIELLRQQFPQTPLCVILGSDAWRGFDKWRRYEDILRLSHLIIAMRPSYTLPQTGKLTALLQQHQTQDINALHTSLGGKIIVHSLTSVDISATEIRNQLAKGHKPDSLLPENVYDYIVKHHLYR